MMNITPKYLRKECAILRGWELREYGELYQVYDPANNLVFTGRYVNAIDQLPHYDEDLNLCNALMEKIWNVKPFAIIYKKKGAYWLDPLGHIGASNYKIHAKTLNLVIMMYFYYINNKDSFNLNDVTIDEGIRDPLPIGAVRNSNCLHCEDCGLEYGSPGWIDVMIPDAQWNIIHPESEGGILCGNCIGARAKLKGATVIYAFIDQMK